MAEGDNKKIAYIYHNKYTREEILIQLHKNIKSKEGDLGRKQEEINLPQAYFSAQGLPSLSLLDLRFSTTAGREGVKHWIKTSHRYVTVMQKKKTARNKADRYRRKEEATGFYQDFKVHH